MLTLRTLLPGEPAGGVGEVRLGDHGRRGAVRGPDQDASRAAQSLRCAYNLQGRAKETTS